MHVEGYLSGVCSSGCCLPSQVASGVIVSDDMLQLMLLSGENERTGTADMRLVAWCKGHNLLVVMKRFTAVAKHPVLSSRVIVDVAPMPSWLAQQSECQHAAYSTEAVNKHETHNRIRFLLLLLVSRRFAEGHVGAGVVTVLREARATQAIKLSAIKVNYRYRWCTYVINMYMYTCMCRYMYMCTCMCTCMYMYV